MKFDETGWKSLGTLEYSRRLDAFLNRMNSGIDRGDEHAAVEHVRKLFAELEDHPLDRDAIASDQAAARKLEDGE